MPKIKKQKKNPFTSHDKAMMKTAGNLAKRKYQIVEQISIIGNLFNDFSQEEYPCDIEVSDIEVLESLGNHIESVVDSFVNKVNMFENRIKKENGIQ